jgi:hypothetical protein
MIDDSANGSCPTPNACEQALHTANYASNMVAWTNYNTCELQEWTSNAIATNVRAISRMHEFLFFLDPCGFSDTCGGTTTTTTPPPQQREYLLGEIRADIATDDAGKAVDKTLFNKIVIADHDTTWTDLSFPPISDTYFVDHEGMVYKISDGTSLTIARRDAEKALSTLFQTTSKLMWTSNALADVLDAPDYWLSLTDKAYTPCNVHIKGKLGVGFGEESSTPQVSLEVKGNVRVLGEYPTPAYIALGSTMNSARPQLPAYGMATSYQNGELSLCAQGSILFYTAIQSLFPTMNLSSRTLGINTGFGSDPKCFLHVKHDDPGGADSGILVTNTVSQTISGNKYHEGMLKCLAAPNTVYNALSVVAVTGSTSNQNAYIGTDGRAYFLQSLLLGGPGENESGILNTFQLKMTSDSAVKPSSAQWTVSSDARLKEDIVLADIDLCLYNVKSIPLKYYKWRDDVYSDAQVKDRHKLGWIAQDVQTVFPKAVEQADMCGYEDCLTLNNDQIYASMYGAIQKLIQITDDQSAVITGQSAVITELLGRVDALESLTSILN